MIQAMHGKRMKAVGKWQIQVLQHPQPALANTVQHDHRLAAAVAEHFLARDSLLTAQVRFGDLQRPLQCVLQGIQQLELVARGKLNIDALDGIGVLAHPLQWDHHVLIDLEGIGVAGNRCGA